MTKKVMCADGPHERKNHEVAEAYVEIGVGRTEFQNKPADINLPTVPTMQYCS